MVLEDPRYIVHEGCDHIFFVGFLGAGKSTLARNLSALFHRPSVDTDRMAERILGKPISRVFAEDGEPAFRDAETRGLVSLLAKKSLLVSCGGGIVETERNIELMHEMGTVVFLDGDLADSMRQEGEGPEGTVMIGDQVFTDVVAGNLAGVRTVLVRPQSRRDLWYTQIFRIFEHLALLGVSFEGE